MSSETSLVTSSEQLSVFLGMEKRMMLDTLKVQCFKNKRPEEVSDEQLAAFVSVANVLQLNPLVPGMLYAYPEKNGGITPIVGPDGMFQKLAQLAGVTYDCTVYPDDVALKPTHAIAEIFIAGQERPHRYTAIFSEWTVNSNPNWQTRPRHMLWIRALKQCARQVIHGLPWDEDERTIANLVNVTPLGQPGEPVPARPLPPKRSLRGVAAVVESERVDLPKPEPAAAEATTKPAESAVVADLVAEVVPADLPAPLPVVAEVVKPAAKPAPVAAKPHVEPPAVPKPAAKSIPVTALEDKQERTFTNLTIVQWAKKNMNTKDHGIVENSVEAEVTGAFTGKVYHIGGYSELWDSKEPVTLHLSGRKLRSGTVAVMVERIELTPADEF